MNVEHVLQIAMAHRGAFDMPARTTRTERCVPTGVERIGILRGLPQREIARIMLVGRHVGRVDRVVFVVAGIVDGRSHRVGDLGCIIGDGGLFLMRQFAIMRPAGHVEVDVAGRIAVLVGHHITVAVVDDLPNKVDHVDHVAGGTRFVGRRLDAERIVCFSELAFVDVGTFPPLLTCGGRLVENLVVDIGDVAHECDLVAETLEPATYHVECDGGADMADMR